MTILRVSFPAPPHLSRLAQQIVDLLADIIDAGGDMGSKRKKNTDELLHHRRIAVYLHSYIPHHGINHQCQLAGTDTYRELGNILLQGLHIINIYSEMKLFLAELQ